MQRGGRRVSSWDYSVLRFNHNICIELSNSTTAVMRIENTMQTIFVDCGIHNLLTLIYLWRLKFKFTELGFLFWSFILNTMVFGTTPSSWIYVNKTYFSTRSLQKSVIRIFLITILLFYIKRLELCSAVGA